MNSAPVSPVATNAALRRDPSGPATRATPATLRKIDATQPNITPE
jgi:hypothetical protein